MGPVHYSRDPQVLFLAKFSLKLDPMTLFTQLKIILLQCFQFLAISGIQTDPKYLSENVYGKTFLGPYFFGVIFLNNLKTTL